jgi:hypothetical protein
VTDDVVKVRRMLADIPDLVAEAHHYLEPGVAPADMKTHHGKGPTYRIPIVAEIFDLLDPREKDIDEPTENRVGGDRRLGVLPTLSLWVSAAYPELEDRGHQPRECCPARTHTVVGETGWLGDYAEPVLAIYPDFATDVEKLWKELRQACRIRQEYKPTCSMCATATRRWLVEPVYSDNVSGPAWWQCTGCRRTWVHDAEVQRLALTQPKMTLTQIASLLGKPVSTLYRWRDQGRFSGGPLYEIEHVRRAMRTVGLSA